MDASGEVVQGLIIPVIEGSAYARTLWMVTTDTSSFTLDTDSLAIEVMPVAGAYDIGFFYGGGPPGSSELIFKHVAARDFQLPGNFFGSEGHVGTNPTATFDMDVQLEGVSIGTISVSTGGVSSRSPRPAARRRTWRQASGSRSSGRPALTQPWRTSGSPSRPS
jgi:hypothetical protein